MSLRILVIDDHPFFREGLVAWLARQDGLSCCGEASSLATARSQLAELKPDLVLLDLQLGDGDGLEILRELASAPDAPRVIVISQRDQNLFAERAIRAGARGYVMKEQATEVMLTAIRTVMSGGVYVNSEVSRRALERLADSRRNTPSGLENLSDRELQVFEALGRGLNTKTIASDFGLSPKTVDYYRESLKKKLGLADSTALIRHATVWVQSGGTTKP